MKNIKEINSILEKKLKRFTEIIKKTLKFIEKLKTYDIMKSSEVLKVFQELEQISKKSIQIKCP